MSVKGWITTKAHKIAERWQRPSGRIFEYDPGLDAYRRHVSDSLTFSQIKTLLRASESGDLATTLALFREMECKDPNLRSVANTRRAALTGADWNIVSAADKHQSIADRRLADAAADYAREKLSELEEFTEVLEHLALAIGRGLSLAELVWERGDLVAIHRVPDWRLRSDPQRADGVQIVVKDHPLGIDPGPYKAIVHMPESIAGFRPVECSILWSLAFLHLIKILALSDWAKFCSLFGMPFRWMTYRPAASATEKDEAVTMLKNMSAAGWALFSENVKLELQESSQRGTSPFADLMEWCGRQQAIAFLGGNLTSDTTGGTGTFAAASVHNDVRLDLTQSDAQKEARTIRRDLLTPLVKFAFGENCPVPYFERQIDEPIDRRAEAEVIAAAQRAGLEVPRDWAYETLQIPKPNAGDAVLEPSVTEFGSMEGFGGA